MTDDWRLRAACAGIDQTAFFPNGDLDSAHEVAEKVAYAKSICRTCRALVPCLAEECSTTRVRFTSGCIRGGAGGAIKRALIRACRDADHRPADLCADPGCTWCVSVRQHIVNLKVDAGERPHGDRVRIVSFGPRATHGNQVTYARGCRCIECRWAISEPMRHANPVAVRQELIPGLPPGSMIGVEGAGAEVLLVAMKLAGRELVEAQAA